MDSSRCVVRRSSSLQLGQWPGNDGSLRVVLSLWAACALLLAGCAHQTPVAAPDRPPINLSGYSPGFRAGFADGCDTARGTTKRIQTRYSEDEQYRRGWDDGRSICARK